MAKVRFGDVVKEYKGKIDQKNNPYEFYVAGDHMDTDDLTIRRKGRFATDDVGPAFIREFKKGHVLYGSRRTYLRKIAVADFDGVTANTTFVLETKDETVLRQRLIPFIMYTESFTKWSIKKSKGSTNPYVLFKDLADYEFELPDIDKQDELVELLWSMNDVKDAYNTLIASIDELVKSHFSECFKTGLFPVVKARDVCDFITKGTTPSADEIITESTPDAIPYLKVYNLDFAGQLRFWEQPQYVLPETHKGKLARSIVYPNDVLMNIVGPPLGKFALVTDDFPEWNINQAIAIFRAKEKILPKYLLHALMHPDVLRPILDGAVGIRQLNLSLEQCRDLELPLPSIEEQESFILFVEQAERAKEAISKSLSEKHAIYCSILGSFSLQEEGL